MIRANKRKRGRT